MKLNESRKQKYFEAVARINMKMKEAKENGDTERLAILLDEKKRTVLEAQRNCPFEW